MMRSILTAMLTVGAALTAVADPILYDDFANGDLGTGGAGTTNAGFYEIDNGGPGQAGSVTETGGAAVLTSGSTKNIYGMLSLSPVSLSNPGGVRTTWNVDGYDLKDNVSYMAFNWQTSGSYDASPEVQVLINMTNGLITVTSNGVELIDSENFDVNLFGGQTNAFSLVVEYTPSQMSFKADFKDSGLTDITFTKEWTFGSSPLKSVPQYYHGTFVNGEGNSAITAAVGDVLTEPIPEPAVIGLIGLGGGSMIFCRRLSKRKKSDSEA